MSGYGAHEIHWLYDGVHFIVCTISIEYAGGPL